MKFPFTFGLKFVFRLVLPGLILALTFSPITHTVFRLVQLDVDLVYIFPLEVIFWGWLIIVSDMHIYMLFEGRRYWPKRLWHNCRNREQKRLEATQKCVDESDVSTREYLEASVTLSQFPLEVKNSKETYIARYPTRLGNLIASIEGYPKLIYGLDGPFFWYRIWVCLDKDLREEVDNQQALADSAIYMSFSFLVAALGSLCFAVWKFFGYFLLESTQNGAVLLILSYASLILAVGSYRLSMHTHSHYGEHFKSLFDQYQHLLKFDDVVKDIAKISGDTALLGAEQRAKRLAVFRWLKWYKIRPTGKVKNFFPSEFTNEAQVEQGTKTGDDGRNGS